MKRLLAAILLCLLCSAMDVQAQVIVHNPFGNSLVPDMIADASVEKIGDTFYCYVTTDGYGRHLETSGPPVVWKSKDFVHWSFEGTYFPSAAKEEDGADGNDNSFYFAFLEFGRRSTNRQTYVCKMDFNADGTIKPIDVHLNGVGALTDANYPPGQTIGGQYERLMHSPCSDKINKELRYLRAIIHSGEAGVWEWNVY